MALNRRSIHRPGSAFQVQMRLSLAEVMGPKQPELSSVCHLSFFSSMPVPLNPLPLQRRN